jgi:hypothetical protein
MSLRLALSALALTAAPAHAGDRLLVAGAEGLVMQADADQGVFEYFACSCSGPIRAMSADLEHLYTLDELGLVSVFGLEDGALRNAFSPPLDGIDALAVRGGRLFVGTEEGTVARLDPASGAVLDVRTTPAGVRALLAQGRFLLAATADGAVYRAPLEQGDFGYFTCFCFFEIQAMTMVGSDLFIVDSFGTTARADGRTGELLQVFSVGPTNSMAASRGDLFFYYAGGAIPRFHAATGQPFPQGFTSPIDVRSMLVVPARRELRVR